MSAAQTEKVIRITAAAEHNLKNINIDIPRDKLVVITGISGSGKSSLAFDTIYAEGRRKYVESLSSYARQFLEQMQKPAVGEITGLPPTTSALTCSSDQPPSAATSRPKTAFAACTSCSVFLYAWSETPRLRSMDLTSSCVASPPTT